MLIPRRSLFVFILLACAAIYAAPPATTQSSSIPTLLENLSSDDWSQRQMAEDQLVALGIAAEPALREWLKGNHDQESRARAAGALKLIGDAKLVGATPITLHLHDADAAGAVEELSRQIGYELAAEPPDLWKLREHPKVTIDAAGEPFWKVMVALCRQAGLSPDLAEGGRLHVTDDADGDWATSPPVYCGPLLLMATESTNTRTVRFGHPAADAAEQSCEVSLLAYAEPKLHPIHDSFSVSLDSVVDERGQSLLAADASEAADSVSASETDGGRSWTISVTLTYPPKVGKKIALMKGALFFAVPAKSRPIEFADALQAKNVTRQALGRRILLRSIHKSNSGYEVKVTLFRDDLDDDAWAEFADPRESVRLIDADGHGATFGSISESESGDKQIALTLQFETPASRKAKGLTEPAKLIWDVPEEVRSVRVPFEYRDLPLP